LEDDEELLMSTAQKSAIKGHWQLERDASELAQFSCRSNKCRRPRGSITKNYLCAPLNKCSVLPVVQIDNQFLASKQAENKSYDGSKKDCS
jgi:hypothetical protein